MSALATFLYDAYVRQLLVTRGRCDLGEARVYARKLARYLSGYSYVHVVTNDGRVYMSSTGAVVAGHSGSVSQEG